MTDDCPPPSLSTGGAFRMTASFAARKANSREPDDPVQVRGESHTARPEGHEHLVGFSTRRCQQRALDVLAVDKPTQDILVRHLRGVSLEGVDIGVGNLPQGREGR